MGLTKALLRYAAHTPHVLLVRVPGAAGLCMDVENAIASRRWREATGPADTDVLIIGGTPGPEMQAVIADVWRRIPAPRLRIDLDTQTSAANVDRWLDQVPGLLADPRRAQRDAATTAADAPAADGRHERHDDAGEHARHEEHDAGNHGGGSGHSGQHDHHHMDMPLPGGLSMADVAEDRDGLTLDVLNLPLGPVLPDWPAGLVVDAVLQGDVIASAEARVLDAPQALREPDMDGTMIRDLDVVARILSVAGWPGPASRARALRDRVRSGATPEENSNDLMALARRVRRSRVLRLMLRSLGRAQHADVADLLQRRLSRIETCAAGRPVEEADQPGGLSVRELGWRLAGAEFAAARLLIAALDPHLDGADPAIPEGTGR